MNNACLLAAAALCTLAAPAVGHSATGPTDPEIAHIAYTAGVIDVAAARQALAKSRNATVREFAREMVRDHEAVNGKAVELVTKLKVTPAANGTSTALTKQADATLKKLARLNGRAFDRAYVANEVGFHRTVNGALAKTLIPSADNKELKSLLETGLTLFREHQMHAEHLAAKIR